MSNTDLERENALELSCSFEFDYAHRIKGHEGKCANLHGHRGTAVLGFKLYPGEKLDHLGMLADYADLKRFWKERFDQWDHACLVGKEDTELFFFLREQESKHFTLLAPPTVEAMLAEAAGWAHEYRRSQRGLAGAVPFRTERIYVSRIRISESPTTWGEIVLPCWDPQL